MDKTLVLIYLDKSFRLRKVDVKYTVVTINDPDGSYNVLHVDHAFNEPILLVSIGYSDFPYNQFNYPYNYGNLSVYNAMLIRSYAWDRSLCFPFGVKPMDNDWLPAGVSLNMLINE